MELKDLDLDLDTRLLKRERLLDGLRMAFQRLGVADPVLPNTSGSKRKFEKAAFQARENLRRLAALTSIQRHLEVMHLEFDMMTWATHRHTHTVEHGDVLCAATGCAIRIRVLWQAGFSFRFSSRNDM